MKVKLISFTPDPERVVAAAARTCHAEELPEDLFYALDDFDIERLIEKLINLNHLSPFEHASFTFAISGVSRALSHQLVRHRIASYSQRSQRFVDGSGFEFVTPPSIETNLEASFHFESAMMLLNECYTKLLSLGIPKEDARFILPNACNTQLVMTMNARSLLNFFKLRCCKQAQWEIRELAYKMLELVKEVAPNLFANAGPPCEECRRKESCK